MTLLPKLRKTSETMYEKCYIIYLHLHNKFNYKMNDNDFIT